MARASLVRLALCASGVAGINLDVGVLKECQCLNWMKTYKTRGVVCGQGLERGAGSIKPVEHVVLDRTDPGVSQFSKHQKLGKDLCTHFYERMNHSYAMSPYVVQDNKDAPMSWCYVSSKCKWLRGGEQVPGTLTSVKYNGDGENQALRDLRMFEILAIAERDVLDLGTLLPSAAFVRMGDRWDPKALKTDDLGWVMKTYKPWMLMPKDQYENRFFVMGNRVLKFRPGWPHGSTILIDPDAAPAPNATSKAATPHAPLLNMSKIPNGERKLASIATKRAKAVESRSQMNAQIAADRRAKKARLERNEKARTQRIIDQTAAQKAEIEEPEHAEAPVPEARALAAGRHEAAHDTGLEKQAHKDQINAEIAEMKAKAKKAREEKKAQMIADAKREKERLEQEDAAKQAKEARARKIAKRDAGKKVGEAKAEKKKGSLIQ